MSARDFLIVSLLAVSPLTNVQAQKAPNPDPARFADAIRAFDEQDRENLPEPGGIVFVGSSSIRRWDLAESFPSARALNRGFGGSQLSDVVHYADRVVLRYRPRMIVLYEGDNDIASGKSPEQVRDDLAAFVRIVRDELPDVRIVVLSIKPSPARWEHWNAMETANLLMARICVEDGRMTYVDVATPLFGRGRRPRPEFFAEDELHLNDVGYTVWSERLRPILETSKPPTTRQEVTNPRG